MSCYICGRGHHAQRLPFLCPVDARNRLYEGRLAQAHTLIENDRIQQQTNTLIEQPPPTAAKASRSTPAARKVAIDDWASKHQEATDRTAEIIAQADRLKAEVEAAREEIRQRKKTLARRKADLAEATDGIEDKRKKQLDKVKDNIAATRADWDLVHESTASNRAFLCMEAARLYGLRRLKKGSSVKYELGGAEIVDLHSLTGASPQAITISFSHIVHILNRACQYLAIRLPAEIILPHADYPRPAILSITSSYSYNHDDIPYPGSLDQQSELNPLPQDEPFYQRLPRARPLFIDKPLPVLAKEDPAMYSLFIEGVALLAHDVAWACCSQGVPVGPEDVLHVGRNLYNLLIGNQLLRGVSSNDGGNSTPQMGRYSHGAVHSYLGGAEGSDFVRAFRLPNPIKLADRLKSKLSSDAPNPDWELLEDDAWT
ncbi:autophagy protein 14 [Pyricularia grisea]|uniref:Autophagy-related protein 14 n=1 Tax=Pyricularia grisea TaxID=148305 RepID=A0A6P8BJL8_PYRGI|nr:uncharacterized protein PgNI_00294 [Pyricularia grisea]KAI6366716.1 autophagy protein 14 [Pyricularia grisea]TLD16978.1 hypothetical protein PgNI_00294 [Pyricularia grisea]